MVSFKLFLASLLVMSAVTLNAYRLKKEFHPTVVYMNKSSICTIAFYALSFFLVYYFGIAVRKLFFGQLRQSEADILLEKSWYALTETCLTFSVYREELEPKFVALFTLLFFLKVFHWLADERIDFMERTPVVSYLSHLRMFTLLIILSMFDCALIMLAYDATVKNGLSVQVIFGFEYGILIVTLINSTVKYFSHIWHAFDTNWENKAVFVLYTELIISFIKCVIYFGFLFTMLRMFTLPIFALSPLFFSLKSLKKTLTDVIMSRRALNNLRSLYPDASVREMEEVCIICREEMKANAKKLPCNHVFHTSCLRSWFQRQQSCPTCRYDVLKPSQIELEEIHQKPRRLFSTPRMLTEEEIAQLRHSSLEELQEKLQSFRKSIRLTEESILVMLSRQFALDAQAFELALTKYLHRVEASSQTEDVTDMETQMGDQPPTSHDHEGI